MKQDITIIAMALGLFGCAGNKKKDFVFDEFKSQIESKGMKIDTVDEAGLIHISQGDLVLKISLDNVRRNYERDKDETHISDLVQIIVSYSIEVPKNWTDAKNDVYISLFPNDFDFQDILHKQITDEFSKIYIHRGNGKLTWITKEDIKEWNITEDKLDIQANNNADKMLAQTPISIDTVENRKLGLIDAENPNLKGALLFSPTMKEKVMSDFGFPFYAVIPVRDFCYIFSEQDFDFFSARIGNIVVEEYKQSGYPVTTEILKFTNEGIVAVGKYPIEKTGE
ncbi:MAG: hypothetical protein LBE91_13505 [Tannerella sp.]|jgi:hypothetical protein|nr:hypothetical protein [Tannerella sp.]